MGERAIKLPDVGEGVAEAELVEWHVKIGDVVREDDIVAAVMTDKATVEIPAPCDGEIAWLGAEVGDVVAVGSVIVRIRTGEAGSDEAPTSKPMDDGAEEAPIADGMSGEGEDLPLPPATTPETVDTKPAKDAAPKEPSPKRPARPATAPHADKPLASPAVRLRARDAGIDLRQVAGSGVNAPLSSSAGRLFDAVAGCLSMEPVRLPRSSAHYGRQSWQGGGGSVIADADFSV